MWMTTWGVSSHRWVLRLRFSMCYCCMNTQKRWKKIKENEVSKTGIPSVYPTPTRDKGKSNDLIRPYS